MSLPAKNPIIPFAASAVMLVVACVTAIAAQSEAAPIPAQLIHPAALIKCCTHRAKGRSRSRPVRVGSTSRRTYPGPNTLDLPQPPNAAPGFVIA